MDKYPFIVTVFRHPGHGKPTVQQYNFELLDAAVAHQSSIEGDRAVVSSTLAVVIRRRTGMHPKRVRT